MNKFVCLPLAVILAGCASGPPKPVLPDGSSRHPVNDEASVRAFLLSRQLADAKAEIARLRAGQVVTGRVQPGPAVYVADSRVAAAAQQRAVAADKTVYRVTFAFGSVQFEPPAELAKGLLSAATQASRVDLRGRTDSPVKDEANRSIALGRALAARRFLVAHGIAPNKIHVSYLSSGDFIADNSTAEGRAQNRRVDIALTGVQDVAEHVTSVSQQ